MHEQNCQKQGFVFRPDPDKAAALIKVSLLDALAEIRFVLLHQSGHGVVVAGIVDQHVVWQRRLTDGGALLAVDAELARLPGNLSFLARDFVLDGVFEAGIALFLIELEDVVKDFDQCLKQIRFATAVLADEHIDKARAVETQREVLQILVVADEN